MTEINQVNLIKQTDEIDRTKKTVQTNLSEKSKGTSNLELYDELEVKTKPGKVSPTILENLFDDNLPVEHQQILDSILKNIPNCSPTELKDAISALQKIINRSKFEELTDEEKIALMTLNINFQKNSDGSIVIYNLEEVKKSVRSNDVDRAFNLTKELAQNIIKLLQGNNTFPTMKRQQLTFNAQENQEQLKKTFEDNIKKSEELDEELNKIKTVDEEKLKKLYQEYLKILEEVKNKLEEVKNKSDEILEIDKKIKEIDTQQTFKDGELKKREELIIKGRNLYREINSSIEEVKDNSTQILPQLSDPEKDTLISSIQVAENLKNGLELTCREWLLVDASNRMYNYTKGLSPTDMSEFVERKEKRETFFKSDMELLEKMSNLNTKYSDFKEQEKKFLYENWFIEVTEGKNDKPIFTYYDPKSKTGKILSQEEITLMYKDRQNIINLSPESIHKLIEIGEETSLKFEERKKEYFEKRGTYQDFKKREEEKNKVEEIVIKEETKTVNIALESSSDGDKEKTIKDSTVSSESDRKNDDNEFLLTSYNNYQEKDKGQERDFLGEAIEYSDKIRKIDEKNAKEKKLQEQEYIVKQIELAKSGFLPTGAHIAGAESMVNRYYNKKKMGI